MTTRPLSIAVLAVALAAGTVESGAFGGGLRVAAGLALWLSTGAAWTLGLFPRFRHGSIEAGGLALGLALVIGSMGGLVLQLTPAGLQATSWTILYLVVTLVGCVIALVRTPVRRARHAPRRRQARIGDATWLVLAAAISALAAIVAFRPVPQPAFSELSMVPAVTPGVVRLAVANHQHGLQRYRLDASSSTGAHLEAVFRLRPGEKWHEAFSSGEGLTEARLVRLDRSLPDLRVHLDTRTLWSEPLQASSRPRDGG